MEDFISDWFIPMDFGNDIPNEVPDEEVNLEERNGECYLFLSI